MRRYIYKKRDGRTDIQMHGRTDGRRTDFVTKIIYPFSKEKAGIINAKTQVNTDVDQI